MLWECYSIAINVRTSPPCSGQWRHYGSAQRWHRYRWFTAGSSCKVTATRERVICIWQMHLVSMTTWQTNWQAPEPDWPVTDWIIIRLSDALYCILAMCIAMCMTLYMAYVFMSISGNSRRIVRLFSPVLYLVLCIHLHMLILQE